MKRRAQQSDATQPPPVGQLGSYTDWVTIDYAPAIPVRQPAALLPYLSPGARVLEVGANKGGAALYLAERGHNVVGIDINPDAVAVATEEAAKRGLSHRATFRVADALAEPCAAYDAVVLIRVLTCFSDRDSWRSLLDAVHRSLGPEGIVYIDDFAYEGDSEVYRERYAEGVRAGWRRGSFAVNDGSGGRLFVAHHHSDEELQEVLAPYDELALTFESTLSMSGNRCRMFKFLGRARERNR